MDTSGTAAGADGGASRTTDDPLLQLETLERQRVEIEAALVVEGDAFAAASDTVGSAQRRLDYIQNGGERQLGEPAERAALVAAQRALDDAVSVQGDAEMKVEDLSSRLQQLYPKLHAARDRYQMLRRKAEAMVQGSQPLENHAKAVGSLPEAKALVDVLVERLRSAEREARAAAKAGRAADSAPPAAAADAAATAEGAGASSSWLEAEAASDEVRAELQLERAEKLRLQQLVEDMKRGNMSAVFRQAQEEAEKEVLKRMLSTSVDLKV